MIRSNRSARRLCVLLLSMLAFSIAVPAGAFAQSVSPTDEQYGQGVLGVASSGSADDGDGGSSAGSISELPFTGLDVAAIAAIGAGLLGAGFVLRRAVRNNADELA